VESKSAVAAKKEGARGGALCLAQRGKRDAAFWACRPKRPELSPLRFLCFSFLTYSPLLLKLVLFSFTHFSPVSSTILLTT
jgi:hypothetical protein